MSLTSLEAGSLTATLPTMYSTRYIKTWSPSLTLEFLWALAIMRSRAKLCSCTPSNQGMLPRNILSYWVRCHKVHDIAQKQRARSWWALAHNCLWQTLHRPNAHPNHVDLKLLRLSASPPKCFLCVSSNHLSLDGVHWIAFLAYPLATLPQKTFDWGSKDEACQPCDHGHSWSSA